MAGDGGEALVGRSTLRALVQRHLIGVDEELADHRVGEVAVRLLDEDGVEEFPFRPESSRSRPRSGRSGSSSDCVVVEVPGLPQVIERDVGDRRCPPRGPASPAISSPSRWASTRLSSPASNSQVSSGGPSGRVPLATGPAEAGRAGASVGLASLTCAPLRRGSRRRSGGGRACRSRTRLSAPSGSDAYDRRRRHHPDRHALHCDACRRRGRCGPRCRGVGSVQAAGVDVVQTPSRCRTNTSHSGKPPALAPRVVRLRLLALYGALGRRSSSVAALLLVARLAALASVRLRSGLPHPGARRPRQLHLVGDPLAIAWAVALDDLPEVVPVDRPRSRSGPRSSFQDEVGIGDGLSPRKCGLRAPSCRRTPGAARRSSPA